MTGEGVAEPSDRETAVLYVRGDESTVEGVASRLSDREDSLVVASVTVEDLPTRLAAGRVDCVVVDATGGDLTPLDATRRESDALPVVVAVTDPEIGERALAGGATAVHRVDGRGSDGLLARRIESVVDRERRPTGASSAPETDDPQGHHEPVVERITDGVVALDEDWTITYVNDRALSVFSIDDRTPVGRVVWELLPDAQGRPFFNAARRALDEQEKVTVKERFDDAWYELRVFPSEDGVTTYLHDVTERKRRDERLGRLLMTTRALMAAGSRDDVATTVASAVKKVLGHGYGRVYLVDEDTGSLVPSATADDVGAGHPDAGLLERAFERESPVVEGDLDGGLASVLALPLGTHGVLAVGAADPDTFAQSDIAIGEILTANAVAALDRADRQSTLERYEDVLETVQGMVYALDADGRFTLVTDPLADRLGYDRAELEGQQVSRVLDDAGLARGESIVEGLLSTDGESHTYETEMLMADGETHPVEVEISLLPFDDEFRGSVGAVRDRTELEQAREALETERDRFTYLFENMPDPVAELEYVDEEPIVRNVNQAFADTFHVDPDGIVGESLNDHVVPYSETRDRVRRLDERLSAGEFVTEELRRETGDGIGDFLMRGIPYRTDDETTRVFGIYTDITDQKRRQRRLGVLNRVLRHNVRNEMTIIRGYSRMIADRLVGEGEDRDLAEAAVELAESAATIEDLSTEARRVEKVLKEDHEGEIDLADVASDVVDELRSAHSEADVETDLSGDVVAATTDRIRLPIEHLVENAVEHNDSETPSVRVSTRRDDDDRAVVRVDDDGPGIPDYERGVVTGDREVTQLEHGSGLGLWIVKWTVEGFGGHVRFPESDLGGAAVELRLPRPESGPGSGGSEGG